MTEPSGIPREFEEDDWLIVHLHGVEKGREAERAKIVAWLRGEQVSTEKLRDEMNRFTAGWRFADEHASALEQSANCIEAGEHLK